MIILCCKQKVFNALKLRLKNANYTWRYTYIKLNVVQVQFSAFSPTCPHHPRLAHVPPLFPPTPLVIVRVSFIIVPTNPSPFSPEIPSPLPSGHCQPVLNFSLSNERLKFSVCLFVQKFCLFVCLLIRFLLNVRSYGICPSLPGLFLLA